MKFLLQVRKGKIAGPLRKIFDLTSWGAEYAALGEGEEDRALHDGGVLIYQKANAIRAFVKFANAAVCSPTTKVRSLVAVSNLFAVETERRTKAGLPNEPLDTVMIFDALTFKLGLPTGARFSPDEIFQGLVDGCQIPLRIALEGEVSLDGVPKFATVNWAEVWRDVNLGILYRHLEELWDDCLWNEYRPKIEDGGALIRFLPADPEWSRRLAASQLRFNNIAAGFLGIITGFISRQRLPNIAKLAAVRKVKAIRKVGRHKRIVFFPSDAKNGSNEEAALIRLYISETAFPELLSEAQASLEGATIDHLLNAWIIVRQIGSLLREDLYPFEVGERPALNWVAEFAPVIERTALIDAVMREVGVPLGQARAIVEFLTYRGRVTQELWAQPMVPVSSHTLMPLFAALTAAPARLIDVWLRQLGVDLGIRGPAFEMHVRGRLLASIEGSELQTQSAFLPQAFVFRPPVGRQEEIDLVLRVGDLVLVGELKCVLRPTETKGIAEHRKVLIGAAAQVQRKVAAARGSAGAFRQQLIAHGMEIPESLRIIPMVVTNTAIHVGFAIEGVPVVDLHVLDVFFTGFYSDTVISPDGETRDVQRHRIWSRADDAPKVLETYLAAPPQMTTYTAGLRERWVPISRMSSNDCHWLALVFESVPDTSALRRSLEIDSNHSSSSPIP